MAYRDLRDFLKKLEKAGELKRISAEVDPVLEITEISDRAVKSGGPALLFERPRGSRFPAVTNLVGSERRMNLALEVESLDEIAGRISSILDMQSPQGLLDKVKMLPKLAEIGTLFPKTVRSGDCQEVVRTENFSLLDFPILQCWPQDGGRYITWPMVITKNPETGKRNVGCYRMQVFDSRTTGMHWQTQKHGAEHFRSARSKNRRRQTGSSRCDWSRSSYLSLRAFCPCLRIWTNSCFRAFCGRIRWNWWRARLSISKCLRTRKSFSKAMWSLENCARKAPLATTPAFIRLKGNTRYFTSTA